MEILKKKEKDEEQRPKKHQVLLELDGDDEKRLRAMVGYTDTSQADVLRQCLRYVHDAQFGGGAA